MSRTPNPVYRPTPPGTSAAVLGALSVVVGALVVAVTVGTSGSAAAFAVGALMVIGGLLLRIEAAILLSGGRSATPNDGPASGPSTGDRDGRS
ncbi:hypothetical protein [Micromonospora siamensis]|uniref:Uncharacterized protein n=1 Tax=Micromonospora siamensis TaxID=299152 RepID=A0A1C5J474_9ACTN|nr:hypothetical protein [Micromonospora siamensis]SCG65357.1 hypothetical protein GA0074704_4099 [Micromonospora siamensis]